MAQAFFAFIVAAAKKIAVDIAIAVAVAAITSAISKANGNKRPIGFAPIKQPVPARHYAYGRGRKPGAFLLYESVPKYTLDVLAFCDGRCGGNVIHYFNDDVVTLDGSGNVNQIAGGHYGDIISLSLRDGTPGAPAHANVVAQAGTLWTADHLAEGQVTAGMVCRMVSNEKMPTLYPNGEIDYSQARDWLCVYDWRKDSTSGGSGAHRRDNPATWEYTANPVVCWVHDKWAVQGYDWTRRFSRVLDILTAEADAADELVDKQGGGTVRRYEAFVWYDAEGDPKETDDRFRASCDGWMTELGDGSLIFRVGRWIESPHVITEEMILDYSWIGGLPKSRLVNEVQPRFRVPELLYELSDAPAFLDPVSQAARGRFPATIELEEVTNVSQAMRIAKSRYSELAAFYTGRWVLDLDRLPRSVFSHRFHKVQIAGAQSSLEDTYVEFLKPQVNLLERTFTAQVRVVDPSRYDWTAAEEGGGVPIVDGGAGYEPPVPVIDTITVFEDSVGSATGVRLRITLEEAYDAEVRFAPRYRISGEEAYQSTGYQDAIDVGGVAVIETPFVPAAELEVQCSAARTNGVSDWSPEPPEEIDATFAAPADPPTEVTAFDLGVTAGAIRVEWRFPSAPFGYVQIKRGTTAVEAAATYLTDGVDPLQFVGGQSAIGTHDDDSVSSGLTYWYWPEAFGGAGGQAVAASPGSATAA